MKIISKERIDAKVIKKYDRARTPYARLMECGDLDDASKEELRRRKDSLDLISLLEKNGGTPGQAFFPGRALEELISVRFLRD